MAAAVKSHSSSKPKCESATLILEREGDATCQSPIAQSTGQNWSNSQFWSNIQIWSKTGQTRGV